MINLELKTNKPSVSTWLKELKEFQLDNYFETSVLSRSYLLIPEIKISLKEENQLSATIQSTQQYTINIIKDADLIKAKCTCPFVGPCKHIAALILSEMKLGI